MNRPKYEYRCGTCRSTELLIRPKAPASEDHPLCFQVWCANGHQLVGTVGTEFVITPQPGGYGTLEFRMNSDRNRRLRYGSRD